jgi:hypothetical protein
MSIPGFTADLCVEQARFRQMGAGGAPRVHYPRSTDVISLQDFGSCFNTCQDRWVSCLKSCGWWEWVVGDCIPKCRVLWVGCLTRC